MRREEKQESRVKPSEGGVLREWSAMTDAVFGQYVGKLHKAKMREQRLLDFHLSELGMWGCCLFWCANWRIFGLSLFPFIPAYKWKFFSELISYSTLSNASSNNQLVLLVFCFPIIFCRATIRWGTRTVSKIVRHDCLPNNLLLYYMACHLTSL